MEAARALFGERGFDGTSLRDIAQAAEVDAALIHHYFGAKADLFRCALDDVFGGDSFLAGIEGTPREVAQDLVRRYFQLWEDEPTQGALLAILRSAIDNEHARELLLNFISREIYEALKPSIPADQAVLRVSFIGSQMLGAAFLRYVFRIEPLASLPAPVFTEVLTRTVEGYLENDLPEVAQ